MKTMAVVLITGAGRGLGRALAEAFAERGHRLILNTKGDSDDLWKMSEKHGCRIVRGDVKRKNVIDDLERIASRWGLDVLINNAAIHANVPFSDMSELAIREMIDVNLTAPIILTKRLWPILMRDEGSLVVNINSLAGRTGSDRETIYCVTKYGLRGFSSALQFDGVRDGVRVIDVCLGAMKTDMTKHRDDCEKLIDPSEAAHLILNLCEPISKNQMCSLFFQECPSTRVSEIVINRRLY